MATEEGDEARQHEKETIENLLTNDGFADQTIRARLEGYKQERDYASELDHREKEMKLVKSFEMQEI